MKYSIYTILVIFLSASSCSDDFLDQIPKDQLTSEAFYKDAAQINVGIIGTYVPLQSAYNNNNLAWTLGMISDEFSPWKNQSNYALSFNINSFTKNITNSQGNIWALAYNNIARANRMIKIIEEGSYIVNPNEEELINSYLGEAKFIRALNYFNLVRFYGDVPLVTEPYVDPSEAVGIGRTAVQRIYNEIVIPDFKYAAENCLSRSDLAGKNQLGRVTSGAGYTMLGKVYLTRKLYSEAEIALKNVINSGEYELLADINDVFSVENENNKESIFEIQYDEALEDGSTYHRWVGWEAAPFVNVLSSNEALWVSDDLSSLYLNTNDTLRYETWVTDSVLNTTSGLKIKDPFPKKLITTNVGLMNQNNNFIVTRYADVLLMYAEAVIMQSAGRASEVIDDFNSLRERAGMPTLNANELNLDVLLQERLVELSFEGHRWFDLLRSDRAIPVMSAHLMMPVPEYQLLFPIPIEEIQKDPALEQNPGY